MRFQGRELDGVKLWEGFVDFPPNMRVKGETFSPLVRCPNPNHHTEKRHFQINFTQPTVHCFAGCGISGSYEHAIALIEGVSRRQARRRILLAGRGRSSGGEVRPIKKRSGSSGVQGPSIAEQIRDFTYLPPVAVDYLDSRGISSESISEFQIGWNPVEKRITIPVLDERQRPILVIQRAWNDKQHPKYLYSAVPRDKVLYGACKTDRGVISSSGIVLVEGSIDTIKLRQHGIQAFGILGSQLSRFQAQMIARWKPAKVTTMFDPDAAGMTATFSVRHWLPKVPVFVARFHSPEDDPATISGEEAHRIIEKALPFSQWQKRAARVVNLKAMLPPRFWRIAQVS